MSYYQHIEDFEGVVPKDNIMPSDVKRLISHCNHTFHKRYYFFSPSMKTFYRCYIDSVMPLSDYRFQKYTKVNLLPDENKGTGPTQKIHDSIYLSDRFMQRIENMNKLILPKLH